MKKIKIENREIGKGCEPFIIAEVGINHNGEVAKVFEMIDIAKETGVDAVKFQTFKAEEFVSDPMQTYTYHSQGKEITESMLEMFKRYELRETDWYDIKSYCDKRGIMFLSTPQNLSDLEILQKVGIGAVKVGSDDFTSLPLLREYVKTGLPIILSCGMSTEQEINDTLKAVGALDDYPAILLLCTSQYPTPPEDAYLLRILALIEKYPQVPIGFSDHTKGVLAAPVALALGACIFEKHFTLDHSLLGPDHWFSADPNELKEFVSNIRTSQRMLGTKAIGPAPAEYAMRDVCRRSIVAAKSIRVGEVISEEMLTLKRPGTGMPPKDMHMLINRRAKTNIQKNKQITSSLLE